MKFRAISINKQIYREPLETGGRSAEHFKIQLFLPPTDVPNFIESAYDQKSDNFSIIFNYATAEPSVKLVESEELDFLVGKPSGRACQIIVKNIKKKHIGKIELQRIVAEDVERFVREKVGAAANDRERSNLMCAVQTIKNSADQISATAHELVGA